MRVLFIGGTGFISTAVSRLALACGMELFHLNRGLRDMGLTGVNCLTCDIHQPGAMEAALGDLQFDVVADFIAFKPGDVERDIALFQGRTKQFIFISSASVYQKPPATPFITESTPLYNPVSEYATNKIACEDRLVRAYRETGFPAIIVRPSLTYDWNFPIALGGWDSYSLPDRLLRGKPIIAHGDGSSLWVVTHSEDFARGFVGLFGNPRAVGHAFHITSDEVLTWNQIYEIIAEALGVEARIVHIPSDFIAQVASGQLSNLIGDKTWSLIFDNSKIKSFVPEYQATIPFREGIRRTLAWFQADPARQRIDEAVNAQMDHILAAYEELTA
jgi:nucleoside-diphosphate-sugar epimerase